jgi:hypothetical protein
MREATAVNNTQAGRTEQNHSRTIRHDRTYIPTQHDEAACSDPTSGPHEKTKQNAQNGKVG